MGYLVGGPAPETAIRENNKRKARTPAVGKGTFHGKESRSETQNLN
jgi:hypothetical protein